MKCTGGDDAAAAAAAASSFLHLRTRSLRQPTSVEQGYKTRLEHYASDAGKGANRPTHEIRRPKSHCASFGGALIPLVTVVIPYYACTGGSAGLPVINYEGSSRLLTPLYDYTHDC